MIPIGFLIQRKTLVPTKHQIKHQYRSDWLRVAQIDYARSPYILKRLSGFGAIETEAQFAKWIYDSFGPGEYVVRAWRKGRKGFWSFIHVLCNKDGTFRRMQRAVTRDEKEKREMAVEYRKLKGELHDPELSPAEKEDIRKEMTMAEEDMEILAFNPDDLIEPKRGPAPYLRAALPLYRDHEYEDYGAKKQQVASGGFW